MLVKPGRKRSKTDICWGSDPGMRSVISNEFEGEESQCSKSLGAKDEMKGNQGHPGDNIGILMFPH